MISRERCGPSDSNDTDDHASSCTRARSILTRLDCIRDRLAHFYHCDDYTALNAAVGVAVAADHDVDFAALRAWTERESANLLEKFPEFERRVNQSDTREGR